MLLKKNTFYETITEIETCIAEPVKRRRKDYKKRIKDEKFGILNEG